MASGEKSIPVPHMAPIEVFTHAAVTRQEMRPDDWQLIWPELADPAVSEPNQAPAPAHQAQAATESVVIGEGACIAR